MKPISLALALWLFLPAIILAQTKIKSSSRLVGGPCEGCEAIFEFGLKRLTPVDTLPGIKEAASNIKITGTVYLPDGKTPAPNVILYIYHTTPAGTYATNGKETGWGKRHGFTRGWVKTGPDGKYTFFTYRPGIYPNRSGPAHIHLTVLEPGGRYYYLESYHFAGDSLLTLKETNPEKPRGGSTGLVKLHRQGQLWAATRDIILGKNIPGYE